MSGIKDRIEEAKYVGTLIITLVIKASNWMWSRLLLLAAVGVITLGSLNLYTFSQVKIYSDSSDAFRMKVNEARTYNWDWKVLDYLDLCISAEKANDANTNYYCEDAMALYKETFVETPKSRVAENIERKAYGAMKVDMQVRMRARSSDTTLNPEKPKLDAITKFLFTPLGLALILIAGTLLMMATYVATFVIHKARSSSPPSPSDAT
ncbi:hypothetical protein [Pseudomonas sp. M30-35]|uniref:hypothetical protein n=1 Tax=Pseudomonas sp. M30-35 TaxID=1981174 RepID=UPI000B3C4681|nr:hypothetical protein [Pseudomonas sp. M30-35]ARU87341.1 hypothetical protein B9K09_04805 [Pseudomonas sp. M30-35]